MKNLIQKIKKTALLGVMLFGATQLWADDFQITKNVLEKYNGTSAVVEIPAGVTEISSNAFKNNETMTELYLHGAITFIGSEAFKGCTNLEKVHVGWTHPANVATVVFPNYSYSWSTVFADVNLQNCTLYVGNKYAKADDFRNAEPWKNFGTVQAETTDAAWAGQTEIFTKIDGINYLLDVENQTATVTHSHEYDKFIYAPGGGNQPVVTIKNSYTGEVNIPGNVIFDNKNYSVTEIGRWAFRDATPTKVSLPASVTRVQEEAFRLINYGGTACEIVFAEQTTVTLGENAMYNANVSKVDMGGATLADGMLPAQLLKESSVSEFVWPKGVSTIGRSAFYNCKNLTEVVVPRTVQTIDEDAWKDCTGLEKATLYASSGKKVSANVFGDSNIEEVVVYGKNPTSGTYSHGTFNEYTYSNATLSVPYGTTSAYKACAPWSSFVNIVERDEDAEEPAENYHFEFESTNEDYQSARQTYAPRIVVTDEKYTFSQDNDWENVTNCKTILLNLNEGAITLWKAQTYLEIQGIEDGTELTVKLNVDKTKILQATGEFGIYTPSTGKFASDNDKIFKFNKGDNPEVEVELEKTVKVNTVSGNGIYLVVCEILSDEPVEFSIETELSKAPTGIADVAEETDGGTAEVYTVLGNKVYEGLLQDFSGKGVYIVKRSNSVQKILR